MTEPVWTLESALVFIRALEPELVADGFHPALAGSVLVRGQSFKDLDLIVYPHRVAADDTGWTFLERVHDILRGFGMRLTHDALHMQREWAKKGSPDLKHVSVYQTSDGRRVDVFLLM